MNNYPAFLGGEWLHKPWFMRIPKSATRQPGFHGTCPGVPGFDHDMETAWLWCVFECRLSSFFWGGDTRTYIPSAFDVLLAGQEFDLSCQATELGEVGCWNEVDVLPFCPRIEDDVWWNCHMKYAIQWNSFFLGTAWSETSCISS